LSDGGGWNFFLRIFNQTIFTFVIFVKEIRVRFAELETEKNSFESKLSEKDSHV
jgi:hypothetical protein